MRPALQITSINRTRYYYRYPRRLLKKGERYIWIQRHCHTSTMMTVGVGRSRRYCNTGYDQSQGRRPSTLRCIGSITKVKGIYILQPNHPSEITPKPSDWTSSRLKSVGRFGGTAIPDTTGLRRWPWQLSLSHFLNCESYAVSWKCVWIILLV